MLHLLSLSAGLLRHSPGTRCFLLILRKALGDFLGRRGHTCGTRVLSASSYCLCYVFCWFTLLAVGRDNTRDAGARQRETRRPGHTEEPTVWGLRARWGAGRFQVLLAQPSNLYRPPPETFPRNHALLRQPARFKRNAEVPIQSDPQTPAPRTRPGSRWTVVGGEAGHTGCKTG